MIRAENFEKNVVLAPFTTYKIGGKADYFFIANSKDDLTEVIRYTENEKIPLFILGIGANILIGDKGFRGLVVHNRASNSRFDGNLLITESGATISDLINQSVEMGLSGLEHFAGIPSTVGGAMRQNLHFLSPDRKNTIFIESIVKEALFLEDGKEKKVKKDYFQFGYDDSILHHKKIFVLEVTFELHKKDPELIKNQISADLAWRNEKQPPLKEFPSCGSIFKKINGVGAGRLIDKVGLKGRQIGGARVSEKHANFIVNTGHATAEDVRKLISLIQEKVLKETGYKLEPEIEFVGEF